MRLNSAGTPVFWRRISRPRPVMVRQRCVDHGQARGRLKRFIELLADVLGVLAQRLPLRCRPGRGPRGSQSSKRQQRDWRLSFQEIGRGPKRRPKSATAQRVFLLQYRKISTAPSFSPNSSACGPPFRTINLSVSHALLFGFHQDRDHSSGEPPVLGRQMSL